MGKTRQALAIVDFYKEDYPLLIVTNKSTRQFWADEIRKLLPIAVHYIHIVETSSDVFSDAKIVITNYPLGKKTCDKLVEKSFGMVIFDESHNLKNSKSETAKLASEIAKSASRIILISGTPALSRPVELFQQLQILDRKNFSNYFDFTKRYCAGHQAQFGWDDRGKSNTNELSILLNYKYMIRRTKNEVMSNNVLPEKKRHIVKLSLGEEVVETQREALSQMQSDYQDSRGGIDREKILIEFYSYTAKLKKQSVCAYLENLLNSPEKIIVFCHHQVMMDAICDFYLSKRTDFIRIDGSTSGNSRSEYIEKFQRDNRCRVAVLSIRACE